MRSENDRFNPNRPGVCSGLRWKGMFVTAKDDPSVPRSNAGLFWCVWTQTCIGPDGRLAEPGDCADPARGCHERGRPQ